MPGEVEDGEVARARALREPNCDGLVNRGFRRLQTEECKRVLLGQAPVLRENLSHEQCIGLGTL